VSGPDKQDILRILQQRVPVNIRLRAYFDGRMHEIRSNSAAISESNRPLLSVRKATYPRNNHALFILLSMSQPTYVATIAIATLPTMSTG
jgi:hypothetical protein